MFYTHNEILLATKFKSLGKWMELEMIMLTEITRNQKGKCHVFLSYAEPRLKFVCVHACVWIRKLEIVHERGRRDIKREKLDVMI